MDTKPPDLNNVRYLIEVADSGSISAAARRFGLLPSAVSRKLARLEKDLGARLFHRTTRSLTLTDAGEAFIGHARAALQSMALASESVSQSVSALSGRIRLSAPYGAAPALWAVIAGFLDRNPDVRVDLVVSERYVDLIEERIDLAIRSSAERHSLGLMGRRLTEAPKWLVASPAYLAAHGTPRDASELKQHACVILGPSADRATWRLQVGKRIENVVVQGRIAVTEAALAAQCTADGLGIAFLPMQICKQHLDADRLVRVLPDISAGDVGLWLVYPDRNLPAVSRALADLIVQELPGRLQPELRT